MKSALGLWASWGAQVQLRLLESSSLSSSRSEINIVYSTVVGWASQVALVVKNLPANVGEMGDTMQVQFLGWVDPLE